MCILSRNGRETVLRFAFALGLRVSLQVSGVRRARGSASATRDREQTFPTLVRHCSGGACVSHGLLRSGLRRRSSHHCATAQCGESQRCRARFGVLGGSGQDRRYARDHDGHSGAVRKGPPRTAKPSTMSVRRAHSNARFNSIRMARSRIARCSSLLKCTTLLGKHEQALARYEQVARRFPKSELDRSRARARAAPADLSRALSARR